MTYPYTVTVPQNVCDLVGAGEVNLWSVASATAESVWLVYHDKPLRAAPEPGAAADRVDVATLERAAATAVGRATYTEVLRLADEWRRDHCPGHAPVSERVKPYSGPVARDEHRAAHGGICVVEICRCGAERRTNVNGVHQERGGWA